MPHQVRTVTTWEQKMGVEHLPFQRSSSARLFGRVFFGHFFRSFELWAGISKVSVPL